LLESHFTSQHEAVRAMEKVVQWNPNFQAGVRELNRLRSEGYCKPGNGVVHVIALVGRGPEKIETEHIPSSASLLIADQLLTVFGEHSLPPTVAPIKVAELVTQPPRVTSVELLEGGGMLGATETVTDINAHAMEMYKINFDKIIAQAVVRRIIKKGTIVGIKEVAGIERDSWQSMLLDIGGVLWEAAETADLRNWTLLPGQIQVLRVELPAGKHNLFLRPYLASQNTRGQMTPLTVNVEKGRSTFLLACYPDERLIGQVQQGPRQ